MLTVYITNATAYTNCPKPVCVSVSRHRAGARTSETAAAELGLSFNARYMASVAVSRRVCHVCEFHPWESLRVPTRW